MNYTKIVFSLTLCSWLAAGCVSDAATPPEPTPEVGRLAWSTDGEGFSVPLELVVGVIALSDSTSAIADRDRLHLLDSRSGRHLLTAGREGKAPGEFGRIAWIQALPSGVAVFDSDLRRITFLDETLTAVGTRSLHDVAGTPQCFLDEDQLVLTRLLESATRSSTEPGLHQPSLELGVLTNDTWLTLDSAKSEPHWVAVETSGFRRNVYFSAVPFAPRMIVRCGSAYVAWADSSAAGLRIGRDGNVEDVGLPGLTRSPVTAADYTRIADSALSSGGPKVRELVTAASKAVPMHQTPSFRDFRISSDGHIWVLRYSLSLDRTKLWTEYAAAGEPLRTVEVPNAFEVTAVDQNALLGFAVDSLGVYHVQTYVF